MYFIYIITNRKDGVLYTGVTRDLVRRIYEHRNKLAAGFSAHYNLTRLVYFEAGDSIESAIAREKQLKGWRREWKVALIERENPQWRDVYDDICG